jgi:hypothetical protein
LLAGALVVNTTQPASASHGLAYQDAWRPVKARVADLMSRMSLDDKLGQMIQPERLGITDLTDLATYRIGSLLSGGSSQPTPNTPVTWADMYDNFQRAAMASPLQIPLIYGVDAVHGHNGVKGATVFPHNIGLGATRDSELAGIDMVMVPFAWKQFIDTLRAEVRNGHIAMSRIDDANRRILTKKFQLGLFEHPLTDRRYLDTIGSQRHRDLARQAVRESQVLLKNDYLKNGGNILPLDKSRNKIFVAGKNADDIGNQVGGWTVGWQGASGPVTTGTTILQGIQQSVRPSSTVTYGKDGTGIDSSYQVAVIGELPYAEGKGDRPAGMGLDQADLDTLAKLKASGVPTVAVLVSGRPLDIAAQLPSWSALLESWLPGSEGQGVADVLFGDYNPTGKLPVTWMQSADQEPINAGDGKPALFPFGYGLHYRHGHHYE